MMVEETSRRDRLTKSLTCGSGVLEVSDFVGGRSTIVYLVKGGGKFCTERRENLDGECEVKLREINREDSTGKAKRASGVGSLFIAVRGTHDHSSASVIAVSK